MHSHKLARLIRHQLRYKRCCLRAPIPVNVTARQRLVHTATPGQTLPQLAANASPLPIELETESSTLSELENATKFRSLLERLNSETDVDFPFLGVRNSAARALEDVFGASVPSKAQRSFIPAILAHTDLFLKDVTGSGKTLGLVTAIVSKRHPKLKDAGGKDIRYTHTLVMVPTRELAVQITTWIRDLSPQVSPADHHKLVQCLINGIDEEEQFELLRKDIPRIIVGTPARLLSLYERKAFDSSRVQLLVLDEVDRLIEPLPRHSPLKKKFQRKIHPLAGETLIKALIPARRKATLKETSKTRSKHADRPDDEARIKRMQVVASSATMNGHIRHAMKDYVEFPAILDYQGGHVIPSNIKHRTLIADQSGALTELDYGYVLRLTEARVAAYESGQTLEYPPALADTAMEILEHIASICHKESVRSGIIFAQSSVSVTRLVADLNSLGLAADKLLNIVDFRASTIGTPAAEKAQTDGETTLTAPSTISSRQSMSSASSRPFAAFKSGKTRILVATEHAARGLDLPNVSHVFILGLPSTPASYIHMAGRAGRFGKEGHVMTLLGGQRYAMRMYQQLRNCGVLLPGEEKSAELAGAV
ncbi:hypothetical protein HDU85_003996 [Gaertneriomyces sp. JEL0708]|nr:hypothetical protein HDU85_003996 [Gaertneriomyces sp. JEL0708]